ncbi:MAG TPA: hypothetical protein QF528_02965, partial [Phycisphaerales bacterium]|nr:hypothetical protein [Phycisphaerales bacterium]
RCCNALTGTDTDKLYKALMKQAKRRTDDADAQLDDEGKTIDNGGRIGLDDDVVIIEDHQDQEAGDDTLFGKTKPKKKTKRKTKKKATRKRK